MERNRLFRRFAALSVGTVMLLSLASCAKEPAETTAPKEPVTAEKAITQLQEQSEALNFDNALDELEEKNTTQIGGDTYIRLQQHYEGIPVYGKTIVYAANEDGQMTSVTGNVQDIDPDIDLTPTITPGQAQESIRAYAAEVLEQENANISYSEPTACIYNGNKLAYLYTVTMGGNYFAAHEVLVDSHDASILEWNPYAASFDTNQDVLEAADVVCESDDSNNFRLADTHRNHSVHYLDLATTIQYPTVEAVVANDAFLATAVPNQAASGETYALAHLAQIYDFYADVLGRQSYDNLGGSVYIISCAADLQADQGRATACPEYGIIMLGEPVSKFSEPLGKAMDLVAHEYAHLVFQTEVGHSTDLDVTSVNEGIADIFGNLIELYVNGEQDTSWPLAEDAGYVKYNMADPLTMASYGNEDHDNAHILSHSAYLMWNGIDGTESKRLSEQQLAELWYRAVLMMPSDCDFILCRQLVEVAAQSMEDLTDEQRTCIREAFDRVGIASSRGDDFHADYVLAEDATLTVYDQNNEPYSGYTLRFSGSIDMKEIASNMTPDIGWVVNRTVTVEEAGPYVLDLPQGRYTLMITDPHYDETYTIYVEISDEYTETNIDLITAYEEPLVVVIPNQTVLGMEVMYLDDRLPNITTYNYSPNGLLQSETQWDGEYYGTYYYEYVGKTTTYQYNENGFLIRKIQDGSNEIITEYGYQEDGLLSYEHNLYSDIYVRYEYDNNGNCIGSYRYDEDGNLKSSEEYTFDGAGNKLSFTNSWYTDGEVADSGTEYFEYDSDGHLLSSHSDYTKTVYSYDARWNLIRKECTGDEACYTETCSYDEYDRLIKKTVEEFGYSETTYYTYDEEGNILTISDQYSKTEHHYVTLSGGQEMSDNAWKHAYADFIRSKRGDSPSDTCYYLIDIDGDGFPELFIDYVIHASGKLICTFDGTNVISEYVDHSVFIPGSGLLYSSDSFQGVNQDAVLLIKNGQIERIAEGDWIDEEVAARYGDDPEYTWNGETVSRDAYQEKLSAAFDETQGYPIGSISIQEDGTIRVSPNVLNYEQILSILS